MERTWSKEANRYKHERLQGSTPKDFPYFHVKFGLQKGYDHVIDEEKQFKRNFGLNVVRGMLKLLAEAMNRRPAHVSAEANREAVVSFACNWAPYDWTVQLNQ